MLLLKPNDAWTEPELVDALEAERIEPIRSVLVSAADGRRRQVAEVAEPSLAETVLSLVTRKGEEGITVDGLDGFLEASLAGKGAGSQVEECLRWLSSPARD